VLHISKQPKNNTNTSINFLERRVQFRRVQFFVSEPQLGMKFQSDTEAWNFWIAYAGHSGFEVKMRYANKIK
jgi:hypothetical protein